MNKLYFGIVAIALVAILVIMMLIISEIIIIESINTIEGDEHGNETTNPSSGRKRSGHN